MEDIKAILHSPDIVQPMDPDKVPWGRDYDPKTIVRDVLIAVGMHPTEPALNAHLEPLRKNTRVDDISDLATFRWDLADPVGGYPAPLTTRRVKPILVLHPEMTVDIRPIFRNPRPVDERPRSMWDRRERRPRRKKVTLPTPPAPSTPVKAPSPPRRSPSPSGAASKSALSTSPRGRSPPAP